MQRGPESPYEDISLRNVNESLPTPESYGIEDYDATFTDHIRERIAEGEGPAEVIAALQRNEIMMLQYDLVMNGYDIDYVGSKYEAGVDGIFGNKTKQAMQMFAAARKELHEALDDALLVGPVMHELEAFDDELHEEIPTYQLVCDLKERMDASAVAEHIEPRLETVDILRSYYQTFQAEADMYFGYINESDVLGLAYYESHFDSQAASGTGSTGLMQLTGNPYREDFAINPSQFDIDFMRDHLDDIGYNYDAIHRSKSARVAAYKDPAVNAIVGLTYLKGLEGRPIIKSFINIAKKQETELRKGLVNVLKKQGVQHTPQQIDKLLQNIQTDEYYQQKFTTFARYNGDTADREGVGVEHRFIYAATVLFLGEYTFSS